MNKDLDFILNKCLFDALTGKGRIKQPNSNEIAKFVTNWMEVNKTDLFQYVNSRIDKVTTTNLDLALRMVGISFDLKTIDKIIDLVELIESKGDDTSIADICKLQAEW